MEEQMGDVTLTDGMAILEAKMETISVKLSALEQKHDLEVKYIRRETETAEDKLNVRLQGLNAYKEWAETKSLDSMSKESYETRHQALIDKIDNQNRVHNSELQALSDKFATECKAITKAQEAKPSWGITVLVVLLGIAATALVTHFAG